MTAGGPDEPDDAGSHRPAPRSRTAVTATAAAVAAVWLALDQVTKALAVALLEVPGRAIDLGVMDLRVIRNPGGAFGFPGFPGMFVVVSVVVLVLVTRALPRTDHLGLAVAYGLVTGGAVGNLVDRLTRAPGFPSGSVVDFFDLRWWPVFNVADVGIVTGALAIAVLLSRADREERAAQDRRDRRAAAGRSAGDGDADAGQETDAAAGAGDPRGGSGDHRDAGDAPVTRPQAWSRRDAPSPRR